MQLSKIYRPIEKELTRVEQLLRMIFRKSEHKSVTEISEYLLSSKGKRLRPALVILSAKVNGSRILKRGLTKIASAVELIHLASLIHDDVIDHSKIRHNKETVNFRWGEDVSIVWGDYLYSVGFDLISSCKNADILSCISQAARLMCEGELVQTFERDNLNLLKSRYITIVKKKTASLFAASCHAGAILSDSPASLQRSLTEYGTDLGIAFQIVDDCLDLLGEPEDLGKSPGTDFRMGELTLPVLNLLSQSKNRGDIIQLIRQKEKQKTFEELRERFIESKALSKTKEDILFYMKRAKKRLNELDNSFFKQSLFDLADYISSRIKI